MGPCCFGIRLQVAVKIFAVIDIIASSTFFLLGCFFVFFIVYHHSKLFTGDNSQGSQTTQDKDSEFINLQSYFIIWTLQAACYVVISAICIGFGVWLLLGAMQRNVTKCKTWLTFQYIIIGITTVIFFISSFDHFFNGIDIIAFIIGMIYQLYVIWVVRSFIVEMRATSTPSRFV